MARHRAELPAESTYFVNLDTVGSPRLVLLEGEGPVWMEDFEEGSATASSASPSATT